VHHREHNDNDILTPVDAKRNSELTNVSSFPTEPSSDKLKMHLFLRVPSQKLGQRSISYSGISKESLPEL
jgi:hypothetical protein